MITEVLELISTPVGTAVSTSMVTTAVEEQPLVLFVFVKVYAVVMVGFATGLAIEALLKPIAGDQLYVKPT